MCKLTLAQAAALCGGAVTGAGETQFIGACMDSRQIQPGELFVALRDKRDGAEYAPAAMERGAAAVLADRVLEGFPCLTVENPLTALGQIAAGWRTQWGGKVAAVTGSVGKTTTKEMIAAVLSRVFQTTKTKANYNNQIGVPLTLLSIPPEGEAAVVEMGMNHFGEISYLTSLAKPDVAVITNIGTMHIEHLGSREGILKAKLEILEGLTPEGTAIFNGDEPLLRNAAPERKPLFFGIDNPCDLRATEIVSGNGAVRFRAVGLGADFRVTVPAEGKHHVYDALAAIAVGLTLGISPTLIAAALEDFSNTGDRQRIFEEQGYTIIADCYNAGPESMGAALEVLGGKPTKGRRIAVLGDMLELGIVAQAAHYRLGEQTAAQADMVFAYGPNCMRVVAGAISAGMPEEDARGYTSQTALAADLKRNARPGDVLLFKGSHGMHMEQVLEQFLADSH